MARRWSGGRAACAGIVAAWLCAGCWPVESGDTGTGGGATTTTQLSGSDVDVCRDACQILIDCGATLDEDACKADCVNPTNSGLVTCFRQAAATCNPLAACVWSAVCTGSIPNGSASCEAGEACEISCAGNPDPFCACGCAAQVRPELAIDIYVLTTCSIAHCSIECGQSGAPASCDGCLEDECAAAAAQCE